LRAIVGVALAGVAYPFSTDAGAYGQIASNLLAGKGLVAISGWGVFRAVYPPLYPVLFAALGPLLNPLIDLAIAWTLVRLGDGLGNRDAGLIAASFYLLWPVAWLFTATPQKDTLAILLVSLIALSLLRLRAQWRTIEAAKLGISAGLLALTQPAFVTFVPIAALILCRDWRLGYAALVAAAVMLPWWVRNWILFDAFVPLTTSSGFNLLVSVTGYYAPMKPFLAMGELEGSKAALREALRLFADNPVPVLIHRAGSAVRAFALEGYVPAVFAQAPWPGRSMASFVPLLQGFWVALVLASAWGFRSAPRELKLLLLAGLIQFATVNVWFEFAERHRYLVMPFLFMAAGIGVATIIRKRQAHIL